MARRPAKQKTDSTILVVEDDVAYAETTRLLLEREGHDVVIAHSGPDGLQVLRSRPIDLVLLDYIMPRMTGEEVVKELRTFNDHVQVILQTGYATENPPRALLKRLDIQGYHDKSEGPDKLLIWVDVGLKAAYTANLLRKSREGLRYILSVTPDLHKIQPLVELLQGVLLQIMGLVGASNSFLAMVPAAARARLRTDKQEPGAPAAFLATPEDTDLLIRASTGRFERRRSVSECLQSPEFDALNTALREQSMRVEGGKTIIPLMAGSLVVGVVYLDRPVISDGDLDLLRIFANQAAAAIHSLQLFEMATLDPLTGTHLRSFFEQWVTRELRTAFRHDQPIAMLMADMDGLKQINDTGGHLVGDRALALFGKTLRSSLRESDIAGRYGGDEFAVLLPQSDLQGAERVGKRLLTALEKLNAANPNDVKIGASIGLAALVPHSFAEGVIPRPMPSGYFQRAFKSLIAQADAALYRAKRSGRGSMSLAEPCRWAVPTIPPDHVGQPQLDLDD